MLVDARIRKTPARLARALFEDGWDPDAAYVAACAYLGVPGRGNLAYHTDMFRVQRIPPLDARLRRAIERAYRIHKTGGE